jgi:hypothetical protein
MLPLFAFRTKEHKQRNKDSQKKAVRKALMLSNPMQIKRNNSCPDCGHYSSTHSKEGCRCSVYDAETGGFKICDCKKTGESE